MCIFCYFCFSSKFVWRKHAAHCTLLVVTFVCLNTEMLMIWILDKQYIYYKTNVGSYFFVSHNTITGRNCTQLSALSKRADRGLQFQWKQGKHQSTCEEQFHLTNKSLIWEIHKQAWPPVHIFLSETKTRSEFQGWNLLWVKQKQADRPRQPGRQQVRKVRGKIHLVQPSTWSTWKQVREVRHHNYVASHLCLHCSTKCTRSRFLAPTVWYSCPHSLISDWWGWFFFALSRENFQ